MKYYNPNPEFGDAGPHEAESKEALADEMADLFSDWASDEVAEYGITGSELIACEQVEVMLRMRSEFINGLEEVS